MPDGEQLLLTIDEDNYDGKILIFKDLLTSKYDKYYDKLNYDETENIITLGNFLKKIKIKVETNEKSSNERNFYLHNKADQVAHYNITQDLYDENKDILDTLPIILFIRTPNTDVSPDSEEYDSYDPLQDKRLQHLLKYVQYKRNNPDIEGNQ